MYLWIKCKATHYKKNDYYRNNVPNEHTQMQKQWFLWHCMSPDAITMISYGLEPPKQIIMIKRILIILCIDCNYSPCSTKTLKIASQYPKPNSFSIQALRGWIRQPESIRRRHRSRNSLQTKNIVPKTLFWLVHHMSPLPRCPRGQAERPGHENSV